MVEAENLQSKVEGDGVATLARVAYREGQLVGFHRLVDRTGPFDNKRCRSMTLGGRDIDMSGQHMASRLGDDRRLADREASVVSGRRGRPDHRLAGNPSPGGA